MYIFFGTANLLINSTYVLNYMLGPVVGTGHTLMSTTDVIPADSLME